MKKLLAHRLRVFLLNRPTPFSNAACIAALSLAAMSLLCEERSYRFQMHPTIPSISFELFLYGSAGDRQRIALGTAQALSFMGFYPPLLDWIITFKSWLWDIFAKDMGARDDDLWLSWTEL